LATFGIEGIRYWDRARANGFCMADTTYTFNICNGLSRQLLRDVRHRQEFYLHGDDCWETDIRDFDQGGRDTQWADSVDLFFIATHGNTEISGGGATLYYNVKMNEWFTTSDTWQLGEGWNCDWLMAYACSTVKLSRVTALWRIFAGLHIFCGAWDVMYDGYSLAEVGEDIGSALIWGDTISHAWIEGISDWAADNHPITVCVGDAETWNGGAVRWERSHLNRDHLWGHGEVLPSIPAGAQACLLWRWAEG
jgi:Family of unknown function (DUF6345)